MFEIVQNYIAGVLLVVGALFCLAATIGIIRLPDLYTRMHAGSKAGTVGSGATLLALAVYADDAATLLRAIAAIAFFLLTAPVAAHLLARASCLAGYRMWEGSITDEIPTAGGKS